MWHYGVTVLDGIWKLCSPFFKGFLGPKCNTGGLHSPSPSPSGFSTLNSRHHRSRQYSHPHHPRLNRLGKADSNSTSCHDTGIGYECSWMKCRDGEALKWQPFRLISQRWLVRILAGTSAVLTEVFFVWFPSVSQGRFWMISQSRPL